SCIERRQPHRRNARAVSHCQTLPNRESRADKNRFAMRLDWNNSSGFIIQEDVRGNFCRSNVRASFLVTRVSQCALDRTSLPINLSLGVGEGSAQPGESTQDRGEVPTSLERLSLSVDGAWH